MLKEKRTYIANISLSVLPFVFFIIINIIADSINNVWESWYLKNKIISYIFFLITILLTFLKCYKEKWFYIWIGFTLYFSSCFLLDKIMGFSKITEFFGYSSSIISDVRINNSSYLVPNIFFILNILFFALLLTKFKVELKKVFYLIFVYYFIYCYFIFEKYQLFLSINMDSSSVLRIVKNNIFLNSLISILFIIFFILVKKKNLRIYSFIWFLLLNFLIINISKINELVSIRFFYLFWSYIKYFLIYSKLFYLLIFLLLVHFINKKN